MQKNLFAILGSKQNSILSGATILMVTVFASRFLGLIRDRLLVHNFPSDQAALFFAAFKLPDLLFQLLIFGALSVAFIPIFTEVLHRDGDKEAFEFANNILNLSFVLFGVVAVVSFIFIGPLNSLILPGFSGPDKVVTDQLSRLILIGQLLLVVGSFFVGISQSYQRFIVPSLAPIFYNLGIIFGIAILTPYFGIMGTGMGVILGAFLHAVIQLPQVSSLGFRYKFSFNFFNRGVREVVKLMSLRNLGLVAEQVNDVVSIALASLVSISSVTLFTFAQHLQVVPIGLFGSTIAQAALPILSREKASNEPELFRGTILTTFHQILFLTLPAMVLLVVLRIPIVRLVFGAAQFSWLDTVLTGRTLAFLALGLVAQSTTLLLVRGFYALKDTKTPVIVSFITVFLNIALSVTFIKVFQLDLWTLGLASAIASNLSILLLLYFLNRHIGGFNRQNLIYPAGKMILASAVAALALYLPIKALDQLVFDTTKTINLLILTGIATFFGFAIYLLLIWAFQIRELDVFAGYVKKIYKFQFTLKTQEMVEDPRSL